MRELLLLLVLAAMLHASVAAAAIRNGPYLQAVTTGSVIVTWETDGSSTGAVEYGLDPSMPLSEPTAGAANVHAVELAGLSASSLYHYRVTTSEGDSADHTFLTAPLPSEPLEFVVVGDTRTNHGDHEDVMSRIAAQVGHPPLAINTGDLVEDGGDLGQWQDFFSIEAGLLSETVMHALPGNHDDSNNYANWDLYFTAPDEYGGNNHYYGFDYGNVHFTVIDTQADFTPGSAQYNWIEADLQAASQDPDVDHLFAAGHWPAYSSGAHGIADEDEWGQVRDHLQPLFEQYGVKIYWCGHDHHYERGEVNGITYIVTGGGGAPADLGDFLPDELNDLIDALGLSDPTLLYGDLVELIPGWQLWMQLLGMPYSGNDWKITGYMLNHFVHVQIAGGYFLAEVWDKDGTLLDTWSYGAQDPAETDDDGDGYTENQGDCDDGDAAVHPDAAEDCGDGIDNDCDGAVDGADDDCGGDDDAADDDAADDDAADDDAADDDAADDDAADDDAADDDPGPHDDDGAPAGCGCSSATRASAAPGWLVLLTATLLVRQARRRR